MIPSLLIILLPLVQSFNVPNSRLYYTQNNNLRTELRVAAHSRQATGASFLPNSTLERISAGKPNPTETAKLARDPTNAWADIYDFAAKIR